MINIAVMLANRATFYRHEILLDKLEKSKKLKPLIVLTSSLLYEENKHTRIEIELQHPGTDAIDTEYRRSLLSMAHTAGDLFKKFAAFLHSREIGGVIAIADRFETLPWAAAAAYLHIPLAHIQGGEVSGNIDNKVRHSVTALSDYHFPPHFQAAEIVRKIKGNPNYIYELGCPSIDVIREAGIKKNNSNSRYIICIFHPHTNEITVANSQVECIIDVVSWYCKEHNMHCYWFASNNDPGCEEVLAVQNTMGIKLHPNIGGVDFLRLLAGARAIIGNSSAGIRESSALGIPALDIGRRQWGRARSECTWHCGFDGIFEAIDRVCEYNPNPSLMFGDGKASERIVSQLEVLPWKTIH